MSNKFEDFVGGEENSITAAHEAGHALVAWLSPAVEAVGGIVLVVTGQKSRVSVNRSLRTPTTVFSSWENGAVTVAGMAAEIVTHQRFQTSPCANDLKALHKESIRLCQAFRNKAPPMPWPESPSAKVPPFENYFEGGLEPGLAEVMRLCYLRARERILSHRAAYGRLRVLLIEKIDRTTAEIAEALRIPKA